MYLLHSSSFRMAPFLHWTSTGFIVDDVSNEDTFHLDKWLIDVMFEWFKSFWVAFPRLEAWLFCFNEYIFSLMAESTFDVIFLKTFSKDLILCCNAFTEKMIKMKTRREKRKKREFIYNNRNYNIFLTIYTFLIIFWLFMHGMVILSFSFIHYFA